jgi:hypothetical protein
LLGLLKEFVAAHGGQHAIDKNDVGRIGFENGERGFGAFGFTDFEWSYRGDEYSVRRQQSENVP